MSQGAKKPFTLIADAVSGATRRTLRQIGKTKIVKKIKQELQEQKDYKADREWKQSRGEQVDINSPMYSRFKKK